MSRADPIELRPLEPNDIAFGMRLVELAGWNQLPADWECFRALGPGGAFLAEIDSRPAGTVTTARHGGTLAWIGMLLVEPELRRRGAGRCLLLGALESLADVETVKLDATAEGRGLYERHGFEAECELSRFLGRAGGGCLPEAPSREVRSMTGHDLPAAIAFDTEAFGHPRPEVLEAWYRRRPRGAWIADAGGSVRGYLLARDGRRALHLGPLVASDLETAQALLAAGANAAAGAEPLLLDAFRGEPRWIERLGALGFEEERRFTRMVRGPNRYPGRPERMFAAAGPEVG